jgi:hypothetical protein
MSHLSRHVSLLDPCRDIFKASTLARLATFGTLFNKIMLCTIYHVVADPGKRDEAHFGLIWLDLIGLVY